MSTVLTEWARLIADTLVGVGIERVVLSPGSRSSPFVLALAARPELRCIDVIDERSAAFLALGMARASGSAVALLCTSGTAAAHWYPAVIEASLTGEALVLLSADRPFELAHCGAAQTIDQTRLFGSHVRFFAELGTPEATVKAWLGTRRLIAQAVHVARDGAEPGPVHLNLRAAKPLEPRAPETPEDLELHRQLDAILSRPPTRAPRAVATPEPSAIEHVAARVRHAERPLMIAGPIPATTSIRDAAFAIGARSGMPIAAEGASQLRFAKCPHGVERLHHLDLAIRAGLLPRCDLVVQIGRWPTSSALESWLAHSQVPRIVIAPGSWIDPLGTAELVIAADLERTLADLARALAPSRETKARWGAVDARLSEVVEAELQNAPFGEGHVARAVVRALPDGADLTIGNSLPIRTLDRFVGPGERELRVFSQRGANGIDGLVASAIGSSLVSGAPSALLLGDVSFAHDVGSLASARLVTAPLAIVIVQNEGGRIFEQLPIAASAPWAMEHFLTPQPVQVGALAAAYGLTYRPARSDRALDEALSLAMRTAGVTIIEAFVPQRGVIEAESRMLERARAALSGASW